MKLARVQILRFAAAAAVVVFHAAGTLATYVPFEIPVLLMHGDLGVDLFFVISGFIIQLTTRAREHDWRLFLRRRIERVVPLYWLCTLGTFLLSMIPGLTRGDAPSVPYLARSLLFVAWSEAPGSMPIVFPGWSLEYEMMFYLVATVGLALSRAPWRIVCFAFAALVTFGAVSDIQPDNAPIGFLFNPISLEFCIGILIGVGLEQRQVPWAPLLAVAAAMAALLVCPVETGWRVFVAGLPAAALVFGAAILDARRTVRTHAARALAHLGDATYSIYLVHVLVISAACKLVRFAPSVSPLLLVPLISVVAISAGYAVHRVIERPLIRLARKRRSKTAAYLP